MTIGDWLTGARARLQAAGASDWAVDPDWMVCEALSLRRSALKSEGARPLSGEAHELLDGWLSRRAAGEPLQYVLGNAHFMGHVFLCDRRSLIPRPDTEALCERAIEFLRTLRAPRVLDLCCGGGAIGLSLALARPDARVTLADLSRDALALAAENAAVLGLLGRDGAVPGLREQGARADSFLSASGDARVYFARGDLFEALGDEAFDLVACNPPYVKSGEIDDLARELSHEPRMALDGGPDGLDFYRRIAGELNAHLRAGGAALIEVGDGQAEAVRDALFALGRTAIYPDLSGSPRVVAVYKGV